MVSDFWPQVHLKENSIKSISQRAINRPINNSIKHSINHSTNQSVHNSINKPINHSINATSILEVKNTADCNRWWECSFRLEARSGMFRCGWHGGRACGMRAKQRSSSRPSGPRSHIRCWRDRSGQGCRQTGPSLEEEVSHWKLQQMIRNTGIHTYTHINIWVHKQTRTNMFFWPVYSWSTDPAVPNEFYAMIFLADNEDQN